MLVVDNGSAYTEQLVWFLHERRIPFEMRTPRTLDLESARGFDSFILSGRKHNDRTSNRVNSKVVMHAVRDGKKLLGICYGAEILALALGGAIQRSTKACRGTEHVTVHKKNPLCGARLTVFESHGFEISRLPAELDSLGSSESCRHELVQYEGRPVFGAQFHPEMSPDGRKLIERFCRL